MGIVRILANSPDSKLGKFLEGELVPELFKVVYTQPGSEFVEVLPRVRPHVAILDRVHERSDAAVLEVLMLKAVCPDARIIVLSEASSPQDAKIVELGVFYYLASPGWVELREVIEAAVQTLVRASPGRAVCDEIASGNARSALGRCVIHER